MTDPESFLRELENFYARSARSLPWRQTEGSGELDAYHVLVSEFMLQQTQVGRVIPKYLSFVEAFPTIGSLARSDFADVLGHWVGLGYNRRAKYLWEATRQLGALPQPWQQEQLVAIKGIGANTAAAIVAYAYNEPVVYLETNIRTVIIHHFFLSQSDISDEAIAAKLAAVLPWEHGWTGTIASPRHFYWAVMDYGTHLKATHGNHSQRSRSYVRQSTFQGSRRQLRGRLIRLLTVGPQPLAQAKQAIDDERFDEVLGSLVAERLVSLQDETLMLYNEP